MYTVTMGATGDMRRPEPAVVRHPNAPWSKPMGFRVHAATGPDFNISATSADRPKDPARFCSELVESLFLPYMGGAKVGVMLNPHLGNLMTCLTFS